MAEPSTIDGCVSIFLDGSLKFPEDARSALDRLATGIVDNDFELFLNRLLSSSCRATPLVLELILSCKHYLRYGLVCQKLSF